MTFEIHLPSLFKCSLNCSLQLVYVFASPLTGIQLSPDAKKLDKTRNLTVRHLSSKSCLMESEVLLKKKNPLMLVKIPRKSIL